ncbi:MAG: dihydroorotase family protein [Desulfomonile sp.]|nr:dihydroorotase family protein [Desulfomonile sp.]
MSETSISLPTVFPDGVRAGVVSFDPEAGTVISVERTAETPAGQKLLFPGFVDIHVHAREYPCPSPSDTDAHAKWEAACRKETFLSAGMAALNGGVTLFCAMPNDPVPPSDETSYARKQELAASSPCPAIVYAAVTPKSEPWADLPYKIYLDPAPSPVSFRSWSQLVETLPRFSGCRVFFHAEDPELLAETARTGPRWWTRPPEVEISAVARILELTTKLGLRSHICHVSTKRAAELIAEYNRTADRKVSCEVTPHHLFFSVQDSTVKADGNRDVRESWLLDCNPPLRFEEDRRFLVEALRDGLIDVLASDHAPHTMVEKRSGAPGMPHLETLGAFVGWLVNERAFSPVRIAEVLSLKPATLFRNELETDHGSLQAGVIASFTVLDFGRATEVRDAEITGRGPLRTRCGWSPFAGIPLSASVSAVVVRGKEYLF